MVVLSELFHRPQDSMADLSRSPTSSWTAHELIAYNIAIITQTPQEFFHQNAEPSLEHIHPALINAVTDFDPDVPVNISEYISHLLLAIKGGQEGFFVGFSRETLNVLGFTESDGVLISRYTIPLTICGKANRSVKTDVCLLDPQLMILLVVRGAKNKSPMQAEPQVIKAAIAAYQHNNKMRQNRGLPILDAMTIPCITMVALQPTFYLVPVTQALNMAVVAGQYPETPINVTKCVTGLGHDHQITENMATPEYRRVAFQHFIAFKGLAREYWRTFLV